MPDQPDGVTLNNQIAHVAVKPPPFWKSNPTLWFVRLEANFSLANITSEITKFNHVVAAVDADVLTSVSDLIVEPPTENPYKELKKRLIESHSESEASKIRTLLQGLELGDQRPSQLLTRMRALAGTSVGEPLLKSLWLGRLPSNTQSILAALNQELSQLATIADKIHEFTFTPVINAASSVQPESSNNLELQIAQLSKQVSDLTNLVNKRNDTHERPRNNHFRRRSKSRDRFHKYREPSDGNCFYHTNFGNNARHCKPPCSFRNAEN
jgi:cleavage and polyadenylation specificity factor subunit 1